MGKSRHGTGVSFQELGDGRWKIRWREKDATGLRRSVALHVLGDDIDRDRVMNEIRVALRDHGHYDPNRPDTVSLVASEAADLDALFTACIDARAAAGKYRGKSPATYRSYARRVIERARIVQKLEEGEKVPVTVLSRDLFGRLQAYDVARGSSSMAAYASLRFALDAWRWGSDGNDEAVSARKPVKWVGLPPAPRTAKDYLPRTPVYGRTIAPTLGHVDAAIRMLWREGTRIDQGTKIASLVMRYTGLRSEQVFAIHLEDVDLNERTLYVRKGKTAGEQADARTIPLSTGLVAERGFRAWVESSQPGPLFPKRRHAWTVGKDEGRTKKPTVTFREAWERATADPDEKVPLHVWAPPNRKIARPEHAFRAAFQAHLEQERVPGNVIDFLVGHEDGSVRDVHYGRDLLAAARTAVDAIPMVDWVGPRKAADNVVPMRPPG